MYNENMTVSSLAELIKKDGRYPDVNICREGRVAGIKWRYTQSGLDIGSNDFDKFGNSTIITVNTYCLLCDGYPLTEFLTMMFNSAKLIRAYGPVNALPEESHLNNSTEKGVYHG